MWEDMATEFLWRWTGQRFGQCEATIRPCRQDCTAGLSTYHGGMTGGTSSSHNGNPWHPTLIGGSWFNIGCGGCGDNCGCSSGRALRFDKPVSGIASIEIDGVVIDPTTYRVDNNVLLVREDGQQWPFCQNMSHALGEPDTWAITLLTGEPVPVGGQIAAGKLACEFAKAACGAKGCELPSRVQSITRQGVSVSLLVQTFDDMDKGRTGIWLVDSWVASVMKPDIGFSMASPDYRSVGRQTTWRA
jgi:hypothetical protein